MCDTTRRLVAGAVAWVCVSHPVCSPGSALVPADPSEASFRYSFTLSRSDTDPYANQSTVDADTLAIYLWLACSEDDGLAAAEFGFSTPTGGMVHGFTPLSGFLNAGTDTDPLLGVAGCPRGPIVAGVWHVWNGVAGSYCLVPSAWSQTMGAVHCLPGPPEVFPVYQRGFAAGDSPSSCPEETGFFCEPVSVRRAGWGAIKSLYR